MPKKNLLARAVTLMAAFLLAPTHSARANSQWPGFQYPGNQAPPYNGVSYNGGGVMFGVTDVYLIFYGDWNTTYTDPLSPYGTWNAATDQTTIINYYSALGTSGWFKIASTYFDQYNRHPSGLNLAGVWNVPISSQYTNSGNFTITQKPALNSGEMAAGTYQWTPSGYKGNLFGSSTSSTATLQHLVHDQISSHSGGISRPGNSIFIVLPSPDVFIWDVDPNGNPTNGDCGFHNSLSFGGVSWSDLSGFTKAPVFAVGDPVRSGCTSGASPNYPNSPHADLLINETSHELMEAITDPYPASGWSPEIGDNCVNFSPTFATTNSENGQPATATIHVGSGSYYVQRIWVNSGGGYCGFNVRTPGDFNGDGRADLANYAARLPTLLKTVEMADSNGSDGTFTDTNMNINFNGYAGAAAHTLSGDFNGNGVAGLVAVTPGSSTIPEAAAQVDSSGNANGIWWLTNFNSDFGPAVPTGSRIVAGDFDGDGKTDLAALIGGSSIAVTLSLGNGFWGYTSKTTSTMGNLGYAPFILTGDFNGDGYADIAATGQSGWTGVALALSNGDGSFAYRYLPTTFANYASQPGVKITAGDYNGDGLTDLVATGGSGWDNNGEVFLAISRGNGEFSQTAWSANFNAYASQANVHVISGDFDGDGFDDLTAVGGAGWTTIPVAYSRRFIGSGYFSSPANLYNPFATRADSGTQTISSWYGGAFR